MPRGGATPDHQRRRLIARLRAKGWTCQAIGEHLGVTHQTIAKILNRQKRITARQVTCKECGTVIAHGIVANKTAQGAFCLSCLAKHPETPFGERLRAHRIAAGLTRGELAKRARVKVANIVHYEHGYKGKPQRVKVERLARVLGAELLGGLWE